MNDYNVIIDGRNFFDQSVKSDLETYDNIRKIEADPGDDYKTACLLDYPYFEKYYKMIAIDLSKQQALDADPKSKQEIYFTENVDRVGNTTMFSSLKKRKKPFQIFHKEL